MPEADKEGERYSAEQKQATPGFFLKGSHQYDWGMKNRLARTFNPQSGRTVMLAIRRTFITPFDRSDINDLISSMDDAIDQMHKTAKAIMLFEQREFQPDMVKLGDVIVKTSELIGEAVPLLRSLRSNAGRLNAIADEVTKLEDESDRLYDAGVQALYRGPARSDPMAYIVGAEIYDHLEKVVDRFEDVANRISAVLIEHL